MASNIEIRNGKASFVENGRRERAWHRLGTVYDRPLTVREALQGCNADYRVVLQPLVAMTPDIEREMDGGNVSRRMLKSAIIPNKMVTMRLDTHKVLGIVSDSYGIVQNEDAFKFIDTLLTGRLSDTKHVPVIETAGVLGEGERVFVSAKFPESIILDNKGNDRVEMYVVFTTSHDGTGAVNCLVTPIRVVCNNTLNLAMKINSGKLSLRHSRNIMERLDLTEIENAEFVYKTLDLYDIYQKSLQEEFQKLKNIKLAESSIEKIIAEMVLEDEDLKRFHMTDNLDLTFISPAGRKKYLTMRDVLEGGVGQECDYKGSAMWVINGITSYYQNYKTYKSSETMFDSIQGGQASQKLQKAYNMLLAQG
jgi:phage/plasmid-like protein (TIGR03299 family)